LFIGYECPFFRCSDKRHNKSVKAVPGLGGKATAQAHRKGAPTSRGRESTTQIVNNLFFINLVHHRVVCETIGASTMISARASTSLNLALGQRVKVCKSVEKVVFVGLSDVGPSSALAYCGFNISSVMFSTACKLQRPE
jgi:hypothetical protein